MIKRPEAKRSEAICIDGSSEDTDESRRAVHSRKGYEEIIDAKQVRFAEKLMSQETVRISSNKGSKTKYLSNSQRTTEPKQRARNS